MENQLEQSGPIDDASVNNELNNARVYDKPRR